MEPSEPVRIEYAGGVSWLAFVLACASEPSAPEAGPGEDVDGDGVVGAEDCDDHDAQRAQGEADLPANGLDEDCSGGDSCFADVDQDGYAAGDGSLVVSADMDCADDGEVGDLARVNDCDDSAPTVNIAAVERAGDERDHNCDGAELCWADGDGDEHADLFGSTRSSVDLDCIDAGEARTFDARDDCDDADAWVHPGAFETPGDEIDSTCDGGEACWLDSDGDGWPSAAVVPSDDIACDGFGEAPTRTLDCDDAVASVHPEGNETCNDVDDDCSGAVDDNGLVSLPDGRTYSTVSAAVADATAGDEIVVCDGVYRESLAISQTLSLRSLHGAEATTIDASSLGAAVVVGADRVTLAGFTFTGGVGHGTGGTEGGGLYLAGSEVSVENCVVSGNSADRGGGVSVHGSASFADVELAGNAAGDVGGALYVVGRVHLDEATVSGNSAARGGAFGIGDVGREESGAIELVGGSVDGNSATLSAGGAYLALGTLSLDGTSFGATTGNGDASIVVRLGDDTFVEVNDPGSEARLMCSTTDGGCE